MTHVLSWRNAVKVAWREARVSKGKFLFVVLAVAAGVGALTGVRGFSGSFRNTLLRDARTLLAADLSVRMFNLPSEPQQGVFDALEDRGVERTWVTETLSMISSPETRRPLLVGVKAVEPEKYPFYGAIELNPAGRLDAVLAEVDAMAVSDDLLVRLNVDVGDRVRLGDAEFRIAATVVLEPDRMTGTMNVGPRLMISRQGLDRAGLIRRGSRASQRYLFRLPTDGMTIPEARRELETEFQGAQIVDFRETHPTLKRGLDRATKFLSLVSLVALIVGALGVGMAMHSHLQQRLDTIAIMKCVGARSAQITRIYLTQTLALGGLGSTLGVLLGYGVQAWFPKLISNYFPELSSVEWQPWAAVQGLTVGVLVVLLFTLPTLLSVRRVRPALIFRRDLLQAERTLKQRWRESRSSLWVGLMIVAAIAAIAVWLGESVVLGTWFAGGLLVSLGVLGVVAWLLLRFLRGLPRRLPWKLPVSVRHGIANLHRPGNHAEAILVALGIGVTFTLCIYLVQSSVLTQLVRSAPPDMPNVFMINITDQERDGLLALLQRHPGIEDEPELVASVAAQLVSVDGKLVEQMQLEGWNQRFRRTRTITWREELPEHVELIEGQWWASDDLARSEPLVAVQRDAAAILGVEVGSRLDWRVGGRDLSAKVVAIHRAESIRPGGTIEFILNPEALADFPTTYYGGVRIDPKQAVELQRVAFDEFPTVTVINAADVLAIVQEVVDQIGLVIRFVSAFAILAGVVILASSVMATRFRRIREVAILKTLGATRRRVAGIFSAEFLVLGSVAGLMGSLLATGFSSLLLDRVLDSGFQFNLLPNAVAVVGTALLANTAGWLSSFRILGRKPLEVLRGE